MSEITMITLDLAKTVFQVHRADRSGLAVLRKKLRRGQVLAYFGQLPPCVVAMEAWGASISLRGPSVLGLGDRQAGL